MNTHPFPPSDNNTLVYATHALPPSQPHLSWLEEGMRDQVVIFTMDVLGQEIMFKLHNPNFLAQLITERMNLAMDNYSNHIWLGNILNPLAPIVAPALFHNMQTLWHQPSHFNFSQ